MSRQDSISSGSSGSGGYGNENAAYMQSYDSGGGSQIMDGSNAGDSVGNMSYGQGTIFRKGLNFVNKEIREMKTCMLKLHVFV